MKKTKKKNAITLLALVITIIILLLLAGVAIQMSFGENGLIVKSVQAQKEQARAELYDTAKLSYTRLSLQAIEKKMPKPDVEEVLTTEEFTAKYNIVGGNITDKKGTVIDTKEALLDMLKIEYIVPTSELEEEVTPSTPTPTPTPEETTPQVVWPKVVAGVTIPEEDKDKMIVRIKVPGTKAKILFAGGGKVDYGDGLKLTNNPIEFNSGEYVIKISEFEHSIGIWSTEDSEYDLEILQWGKGKKASGVASTVFTNVVAIYEPEPEYLRVSYSKGKFTQIPEWLFKNKRNNPYASSFIECDRLTTIPEDLFKWQVNIEDFSEIFKYCKGIRTIPENLFKHNTKAKKFRETFFKCESITAIPENLFKYNSEVTDFTSSFAQCYSLGSIPENLFRHNIVAKDFENTFANCKNIINIPEELFKYNTEVLSFQGTFSGCENIKSIPKDFFKYNTKVINFSATFFECKNLISIPKDIFRYNTEIKAVQGIFGSCIKLKTIPEDLFKYNTKIINFTAAFELCQELETIPEDIFKYNTEAEKFLNVFKMCIRLRNIPQRIFSNNMKVKEASRAFANCTSVTNISNEAIENAKRIKENGGEIWGIFTNCRAASNYNSLPSYMK